MLKTIKRLSFILILSFSLFTEAQICDVIENVCSNQPSLNNDTPDFDNPFVIKAPNGCDNLQSENNKWFRVKIKSGSELSFIIEANSGDDYDFAVFGPNSDCNNLENETAIRSNFSALTGNTGLSSSSTNECQSSNGSPFSSSIDVQPGEEYFVVIDSYIGEGQITNNPYNLIWSTSTELDCSIVTGDLGPDQTICEGTQVDLDGTPENTNAPVDSYEWQLDTGNGFNSLGVTNSTLSITNNVSGTYKVIVTDTDGSSGEDQILITFLPPPTATKPSDIDRCDTDGDGL